MTIELYQVDAFTEHAFKGNPAAVCFLKELKDDVWMQNVAAEMNLSETAFLLRQGNDYNLRWFTPTVEEDLCGHATLASAHILWEYDYIRTGEQARFQTRSGLLSAEKKGKWIELNFPSEPGKPIQTPENLVSALGISPIYIEKNRFDYLIEVESEEEIRNLKPDFQLLGKIPSRGIIVTSRSNSSDYDFISRFFAPREGVNEDPVTGSAHCCLGPFWAGRLGKNELTGFQASSRGGIVRVHVLGDRVILGGQAITIFQSNLLV